MFCEYRESQIVCSCLHSHPRMTASAVLIVMNLGFCLSSFVYINMIIEKCWNQIARHCIPKYSLNNRLVLCTFATISINVIFHEIIFTNS